MPLIHTIVFPHEKKSERIDRFLASSFRELSRSRIKNLIAGESVLCNGAPVAKPSYKVSPGEVVSLTLPERVELAVQPEDIPLDILYQDDDLAVINKAAGMMVHPAGRTVSGTLLNALLFHLLGQLSDLRSGMRQGIVHRLDKDTSGVMLIAKNSRSHGHLAAQFRERTVDKVYYALVWGLFADSEGVITKALGRSSSDRKKMVVVTGGKESETHFTVREEFAYLSLLDVHPKTGRTHQIRSHLASIGHPVFGDALYRGRNRNMTHLGAKDRIEAARLLKLMPRQALHAAEIGFMHPATEKRMRFCASLPVDFVRVLATLERTSEV